jgi:hypothetical protein
MMWIFQLEPGNLVCKILSAFTRFLSIKSRKLDQRLSALEEVKEHSSMQSHFSENTQINYKMIFLGGECLSMYSPSNSIFRSRRLGPAFSSERRSCLRSVGPKYTSGEVNNRYTRSVFRPIPLLLKASPLRCFSLSTRSLKNSNSERADSITSSAIL